MAHENHRQLIDAILADNLGLFQHFYSSIRPSINLKIIGNQNLTPLLFSCRSGSLRIVKWLVQSLSPNDLIVSDSYGMNGLLNAILSEHVNLVQFLCQLIPLEQLDYQGNNALHLAAQTGSFEIAKLLLIDYKVPILRNYRGQSPLHFSSNPFVSRLLLENGVGVNQEDENGWTPLHFAAYNDLVEQSHELIYQGAKIFAPDWLGVTPYDIFLQQKGQCFSFISEWFRAVQEISVIDSIKSQSDGNLLQRSSTESNISPVTPDIKQYFSNLLAFDKDNIEEILSDIGIEVVGFSEIEFIEEIGHGGFGKVYKAQFRGSVVAAKVMSSDLHSEKDILNFLKEIKSLLQIRHFRFLMIQGICIEGPLCIITELAANGNLEKALTRLSYHDKLQICLQITEAMNYIHSKRVPIVHRDLKPSNILLDSSNQVKIGDLGLARAISKCSGTEKLEQTQIFAGTIQYMAPELYDENPQCTRATDVWAFGCVVHHIFTNRQPWEGLDWIAVSRRLIQKSELPIDNNLPGEINTIIRQCCRVNPSERPRFSDIQKHFINLLTN